MSRQPPASPSSGHSPSDRHRPETSSGSTHPLTLAGHPPLPPFLNSPPNFPVQPSTSTHLSERGEYQNYSFDQLSTQLSELQFTQTSSHPHPYLTTSNLHPDSTRPHPVHALSGNNAVYDVQPSDNIYSMRGSIYQDYPIYQQPTFLQVPPPPGPAFSSHRQTYYGQGMFSGSHHFSLEGSTFIDNSITADNFMKELLQATIVGAEFDSSDRDPPPRCHPGTRLAILQRCLDFISRCRNEGKLRWIVGAAGVGKSAVMQIVAEKTPDDVIFASVFLSVNGRADGTKTIVTIAYQLAVKCELYRHFIRQEITKDPSLVRKSLSVHFQKFIVEPFIHRHLFDPPRQFLVLIDGLDECDSPRTQRELLALISDFCITNPTSPIAWVVASRPEPHITSFFDNVKVVSVYSKEEMAVDSEEACDDVQRYLRHELREIQFAYPTLLRKRQWPSELELTRIAAAAGGLFVYASTVVRYIDDSRYGDPATQLNDILVSIDAGPKDGASGTNGPLAQLDALYERILSKVPDKVMDNTRMLLLLRLGDDWSGEPFRVQCNLLGLTEDAAYGAIRHLHSIVKVSAPESADDEPLEFFHKSFEDYLCDFKRSGFSDNIKADAQQLSARISLRIVQQVTDFDGAASETLKCGASGYLKGGPDICKTISLSWPGDERFAMEDEGLKLKLYTYAIDNIASNFEKTSFYSISCFQALTTRFAEYGSFFPFNLLREFAFNKLRPELAELGKVKRVPLWALDYAAIWGKIDFRFKSPICRTDVEISDPWNSSCDHEKEEVTGSQQKHWSTFYYRYAIMPRSPAPADVPRLCIQCNYCLRRLARHFVNNPDHVATVFIDSTEMCYVELSFVDPDDGVSEWRYQFLHSGLPTCIA
ncbi:hypothetical protein Agabi119p4_5376 [Agaricus bisporus var. burnettii]|uniref:Nephrocystin 3-like N-terminal domain-containing protein n=1 Tax=Agaricus bisporus var. burnettii TaxID=192524 RepID=A0A8H7F1K9_AGABI|nr:hypothetical protein Agabi119p4_5376 [Agaricus bisporus var. burnettii]